MLNKTEQDIIELLNIHYGFNVHEVHCVAGGADVSAFAFKVVTNSGTYFVKLKYGAHDQISLSILRLLHKHKIQEIIFPILTKAGTLFQQLHGFKIITYPFIDAPNGFIQALSSNQWKQLGESLRKIHNIPIPKNISQPLRKETYSSKWRTLVRAYYESIELNSDDDHITTDFKSIFKAKLPLITQLVNSAEKLALKIQPNLKSYVLCHSDLHAGNVLVTKESIYIIDWDEPMLAPKERDLMFIGGGVGNVWNQPQEVNHFYEGYGNTKVDKTLISYYRCERIVQDIAEFSDSLLTQKFNESSRLEMLAHFQAMFAPNGVVDIALSLK